MSEKILTLNQIVNALESMNLSEEDKLSFLKNILNTNSQNESIKTTLQQEEVDKEVDKEVDNVNNYVDKKLNKGKNYKFWQLAQSFLPSFSQQYKTVMADGSSFLQKTIVKGVVAESDMSEENKRSFLENIKRVAYKLGVTISHYANNMPGSTSTIGSKFISIIKFTGDARAVTKLEKVFKKIMDENDLNAANYATPNLLIEEISEKEEIKKVSVEHAEKYNYEISSDTGEIVFKSYSQVNANVKLNYIKRNFSIDIKSDLDEQIKHIQSVNLVKTSKNITLLNNYSKAVDVFPDEVMSILKSDPSGANLPDNSLLPKLLMKRIEILNESTIISNEKMKARVKMDNLLNISSKMLEYVSALPDNNLFEVNRVVKKSFINDFLNKKVGVNKVGELINKYKSEEFTLKELNIENGSVINKTSVDKANDVVLFLNKSIGNFIQDIKEMHLQYSEYNEKIKLFLKVKNPTQEERESIDRFKLEVKLYIMKYNANYQNFGEEYNDSKKELSDIINSIRRAKHFPPKEGTISNKEYAKQAALSEKHNSYLLAGASNSVLYLVNTIGSLSNVEDQMLNYITKECGLNARDIERLSEDYEKLENKFASTYEINNKNLYKNAADLVLSFKDINETFFKLEENIRNANKYFLVLIKNGKKIEDAKPNELSIADVSNLDNKMKTSLERYENNKKTLEEEFDLKFSAFRRLYVTKPNAKNYLKQYGAAEGFDVRTWIDSSSPLDKLDNEFQITRANNYKKIENNIKEVKNLRETVVSIYLKNITASSEIKLNSSYIDEPVKFRKLEIPFKEESNIIDVPDLSLKDNYNNKKVHLTEKELPIIDTNDRDNYLAHDLDMSQIPFLDIDDRENYPPQDLDMEEINFFDFDVNFKNEKRKNTLK